jgi:CubicO group peptidase (beta-lactamase class C family)
MSGMLASALVLTLLGAAHPIGQAAASTPNPASTQVAQIDQIFSRWNSTTLPGCTVGVSRDGRPLLSRAYGMSDLEHGIPNRTDSIIEAGSLSKQFTAAAVLLLVQQGKVALDDPARKYIKEIPDYGAPLTVRHMLTHTSGLRDWGAVASIAGWPRTTRAYTHAHVLDIVSRQRSLNFPPGSAYSYSNTGYNLAAVLVSRVSGKGFADFTRENLFEPLGMTRTSWRDDFTRVVKDRSIAYDVAPSGVVKMDMPFENVHGNGGLLTTVGDLLKWTENAVHAKVGGRVLIDLQRETARLKDGEKIEYAFGLRVSAWRGVPEVSHSGATAGYRAWLAQYPSEGNLSVAVLCNASNAGGPALGHRVADLFLKTPPVTPRTGAGAPIPETMSPILGLYKDRRRNDVLSIERKEGEWRATGVGVLSWISKDLLGVEGSGMRLEIARGAAPDAVTGLRVVNGAETLTFDRVEPANPSAADLLALVGEYESDDAELTVRVAVEKGQLTLHRRPDTVFSLKPTFADAFASDLGGIRFFRGPGGAVSEMSVTQDRVWDLRFHKLEQLPTR